MTRILALDTALGACSAAVLDGSRPLARRFEILGRGHAERLAPMIAEVMAEASLAYGDLDGVAVTVGPGTFTGVRIGLAAARGLALALDRPLVGVTTLEAVAIDALVQDPGLRRRASLTVAHDARRGEVYLQSFRPVEDGDLPDIAALDEAAAVPIEAAGNKIPSGSVVVGTGLPLLKDLLRRVGHVVSTMAEPAYPDALVVARIASKRMAEGPLCYPPRPLYLRSPDARLPDGTGL